MRAATEGSLWPVMPQGNLVEVLGRGVRQGWRWLRALLPARGGDHVKQTRRSQMRLRTRPPLLTYLLDFKHLISTEISMWVSPAVIPTKSPAGHKTNLPLTYKHI